MSCQYHLDMAREHDATQVYTHVSQTETRRAYMAAHPLAHRSRGKRASP